MTSERIGRGKSLLACEKIARQLGCDIRPLPGTGEVLFSHPKIIQPARVNKRRKDASRFLTSWLNRICKLTETIQ
jgi:hypothetical protein